MNNELIGIISNESELKGVIEDNSFNVKVQITESGPKGDPGVGLQYEWVGSKLGIKTEAEPNFEYVDLAAASGDIAYTHNQISASREWLVCHNLNKHPSVTVVDSASTVVVGDIAYLNTEELIISFTSEFSGRAFLN